MDFCLHSLLIEQIFKSFKLIKNQFRIQKQIQIWNSIKKNGFQVMKDSDYAVQCILYSYFMALFQSNFFYFILILPSFSSVQNISFNQKLQNSITVYINFRSKPMSFVPDNNALYRITTALNDNMVLDASQKEGQINDLILYKWNSGPNQKFAIRSLGDNKYAFFCSLNNGTIQVPEGSTKPGEKIVVAKPNKAINEFWQLVPVNGEFGGKNAFYFKSFCGLCLDVYEQKAKNNQPVVQWQHTGGKNQVWIIEQA